MRKDRFTDEAMAAARALADLKYSENAEDQQAFAEAYDFARCQRLDGSFYAIASGKRCRKGSKAAPAQLKSKKSAAERGAKLVEPLKGNLETVDKALKSYTTLGKGGLK